MQITSSQGGSNQRVHSTEHIRPSLTVSATLVSFSRCFIAILTELIYQEDQRKCSCLKRSFLSTRLAGFFQLLANCGIPCHVLLSSAEERNADTFFMSTRSGGISFRGTRGRCQQQCSWCYPVNRSCIWRYPSARGFEGPHVLFEHLVNGCDSLARVSEKARDGPSKSH